MNLPKKYSYGQLFGFSGMEGSNHWENDFVGTLTRELIGIRFELSPWIKVSFPVKENLVLFPQSYPTALLERFKSPIFQRFLLIVIQSSENHRFLRSFVGNWNF